MQDVLSIFFGVLVLLILEVFLKALFAWDRFLNLGKSGKHFE